MITKKKTLTFYLRYAITGAFLALGCVATAIAAGDEFLDPQVAFRLQVSPDSTGGVQVQYDIAPGYQMYRERFDFATTSTSAQLGKVELPAGKIKYDTNFNKNVEIYRDSLRFAVPVNSAQDSVDLQVTSQGCADQGLCYPPQTHTLKARLSQGKVVEVSIQPEAGDVITAASAQTPAQAPAPTTASTTAPAALTGSPSSASIAATPTTVTGAAKPVSEGSRIDAVLQSGNLLMISGAFLLAGLLLAFTPCVLPMVPILSSIIVGQRESVSRSRGFLLALAYSLGMALVYTAFGVVAGLLGEGLAAALQKPWVLATFALLLVGLALSMFDVYQLQMPAFIQERLNNASGKMRGGRFAGVFFMGGLSALVVGPCVAAPLAGALVYISQTRDVVIGGVALFSLAMGMSVPLLLVGLSAGSLLPRAGSWMTGVKTLFGVMLLGVALWMVSPVLPGWGTMLLLGALMLGSAVFLRAFDRLPEKVGREAMLFKGAGLILALAGASQIIGALSGGDDALQPLRHFARSANAAVRADAQSHELRFETVRSVAELETRLAASGRPVVLDFYADWCVSCKELERFTFGNAQVRQRLSQATLLRVDVTGNSPEDKALLKRFRLFGPPGVLFFDAKGQERTDHRVIGYQAAEPFLRSLDGAGI